MMLHQGKVANKEHSQPEFSRVFPCRSSKKPGEYYDHQPVAFLAHKAWKDENEIAVWKIMAVNMASSAEAYGAGSQGPEPGHCRV